LDKDRFLRTLLVSLALALLLLEATVFSREHGSRTEVTVAAAANLTEVLQAMAPEFERQTGIHPVFSFASTAQLARQIENSAPFDVFAAADTEHVDELERKHLLLPGSRTIYAVGVLALWIPPGTKVSIDQIENLARQDVRFIAVATPELAPYGEATVETLQHLGIWDKVKDKVIYAENINMAKQYGTSNNADAVFTAYSLVLKEGGKTIRVDEKLHRPISQELGILAGSKNQREARAFADYLLKGKGRVVLARSGYRVPESQPYKVGVDR
jgi:molybdate transport system substrate-binding protein